MNFTQLSQPSLYFTAENPWKEDIVYSTFAVSSLFGRNSGCSDILLRIFWSFSRSSWVRVQFPVEVDVYHDE